ncbi:MAG: DUF3024 domain-containing protein [Aeromicrobium sp.]
MSLPEADVALVRAYCAAVSPDEFAADARVECVVSATSVTIVEASRLNAERDEDWLRVPCARLDHDAGRQLWTLWCFDPDSRAQRYDVWEPDFVQPTTVDVILAEIEADPTEIFWG